MAYIHHPVLGDSTYGGRLQLPKGASPELIEVLRQFKHQALHAYELSFSHPVSKQQVSYQAPLPQDMEELITTLKKDMVYGK
jgi:23S rRNA pseudouridine1911/1915/1917 synthase